MLDLEIVIHEGIRMVHLVLTQPHSRKAIPWGEYLAVFQDLLAVLLVVPLGILLAFQTAEEFRVAEESFSIELPLHVQLVLKLVTQPEFQMGLLHIVNLQMTFLQLATFVVFEVEETEELTA